MDQTFLIMSALLCRESKALALSEDAQLSHCISLLSDEMTNMVFIFHGDFQRQTKVPGCKNNLNLHTDFT